MRYDGRKDVGRDLKDIEKDLERLSPLVAPPGLRERVLASALETRRNAVLTPRLRAVALVCTIVIVAVLVADPLIGKHESARLTALLDGRSSARTEAKEAADLAEALGGQGIEADRIFRLEVMAADAARTKKNRQIGEALKGLKGWAEDETPENPY